MKTQVERKGTDTEGYPCEETLKLKLCGRSQVLPWVSRALTTMREAWSGLVFY